MAQYYKTFYHRYLPRFHGDTVIMCYKAILPLQLLWNGSELPQSGNTKGGSITVPLTSCLTGLESAVWQVTIFVFVCKTD
jgi:hypothetical protein